MKFPILVLALLALCVHVKAGPPWPGSPRIYTAGLNFEIYEVSNQIGDKVSVICQSRGGRDPIPTLTVYQDGKSVDSKDVETKYSAKYRRLTVTYSWYLSTADDGSVFTCGQQWNDQVKYSDDTKPIHITGKREFDREMEEEDILDLLEELMDTAK